MLPDGRRFLYLELQGSADRAPLLLNGATVYAVSFSPATEGIGLAREVFSLGARGSIAEIDVAPDGERFLVSVGDRANVGASITIVLNWLDGDR